MMEIEFHVSLRPDQLTTLAVKPTSYAFSKVNIARAHLRDDHVVEQLTIEISMMGRYVKEIKNAAGKRVSVVGDDVYLTSHRIQELERHFRELIALRAPRLRVHFQYRAGAVMVYTEAEDRTQQFSGVFDIGAGLCWLSQVSNWPPESELILDAIAISEVFKDHFQVCYQEAVAAACMLGPARFRLEETVMTNVVNTLHRKPGMPEFTVKKIKEEEYSVFYTQLGCEYPILVMPLDTSSLFTLAVEAQQLGLVENLNSTPTRS